MCILPAPSGAQALGEEAFIAQMKPDGGAHFGLVAFSKPARPTFP